MGQTVNHTSENEPGCAQPVFGNVEGAPFWIGAIVRVHCLADETADNYFLGRVGKVIYYEFSCGCGQSFPNSPMIGVRFRKRIFEFWPEELESA